ncbi:MAG TPA: hypothetical protein VGI39_24105 [Polyangiaceae bacterium]
MSAPPPSPESSRLLALLRDGPPAPSDARARLRLRIEAIGSGGGGGGSPPPTGRPAQPRPRALAAPLRTLAAFLVGGIVGASLHAVLSRPPAFPVESSPGTTEQAPSAVSFPPIAPSRLAPPTETILAGSGGSLLGARATAAPAATDRASSNVSQLAAERAALDAARALLVQGDGPAALLLLRAAKRRFPSAALGEERDALTIEALVASGHYGEANSLARAFQERTPDSLFSATVRGALRSIPRERDGGTP